MTSRRTLFALCLPIALASLVADQLFKEWMLGGMHIGATSPIEVTSFFNLVLVWNKGISFGMFSSHKAAWALIAVALVIVALLLWWLPSAGTKLSACAIGLIVGGALGNVIDRLRYEAVADFFDFHLLGYHWPAFNIADSTIFIGVVLLCWESMFLLEPPEEKHE